MQSDISGRSPAALTHVMMSAVLKTSTEVVSAYAKRAPRMAARRQDPVCSGDFGLRPRNWVVEAMRLTCGRPFISSAGKCFARISALRSIVITVVEYHDGSFGSTY